jgi:hypothetical protein
MDDLRSILILSAFLRTDGKPAVGGEGYFCKYCCVSSISKVLNANFMVEDVKEIKIVQNGHFKEENWSGQPTVFVKSDIRTITLNSWDNSIRKQIH